METGNVFSDVLFLCKKIGCTFVVEFRDRYRKTLKSVSRVLQFR